MFLKSYSLNQGNIWVAFINNDIHELEALLASQEFRLKKLTRVRRVFMRLDLMSPFILPLFCPLEGEIKNMLLEEEGIYAV